eukprot:8305561-Alexandrium_andersonii.AAC.1
MCIRDRAPEPLEPPTVPNANSVHARPPSLHATACSLRLAWWAPDHQEASAASARGSFATGPKH